MSSDKRQNKPRGVLALFQNLRMTKMSNTQGKSIPDNRDQQFNFFSCSSSRNYEQNDLELDKSDV
eukprot:CAMPEP_0184866622 /NCGR_PEP_ID=MMETSP0580-20130426/23009_1 /TAXON_ID=1118495 /ORGANISM="Dactyliosolen fragilissimus" /LENGTH=64 /DNA_ID=CAMNT_0027366397 /DNA_START=1 /DNA_END=192 /DNA_ORIENTATION=+